jgi:acetyl-CoA synthetase
VTGAVPGSPAERSPASPERPPGTLLDLDGALHVEDHAIAGARETVATLRATGLALRFVTNTTSRSHAQTVGKLRRLKPGFQASDEIAHKVSQTIVKEIGSIARPKNVWIVTDMPKTRSGKIMRRVIAAVSNFADVGDVTTLANPEIVDQIRHHVQSEKLAHGEVPRELSEKEKQEIAAFGQAE